MVCLVLNLSTTADHSPRPTATTAQKTHHTPPFFPCPFRFSCPFHVSRPARHHSAETFKQDLLAAMMDSGATIAFDATGGGTLGCDIVTVLLLPLSHHIKERSPFFIRHVLFRTSQVVCLCPSGGRILLVVGVSSCVSRPSISPPARPAACDLLCALHQAMETAAMRKPAAAKAADGYGSNTFKKLYVYGGLNAGEPMTLKPHGGMGGFSWAVQVWRRQ